MMTGSRPYWTVEVIHVLRNDSEGLKNSLDTALMETRVGRSFPS